MSRETTYEYTNPTNDPNETPGLLKKVTFPITGTTAAYVEFEYDTADNLVKFTDFVDVVSDVSRETEYVYDNLNRLTAIYEPNATTGLATSGGNPTGPETYFEYDLINRLTKITDPLGRETQYTYDANGLVSAITQEDHDGDGRPTITRYGYDAARNMTSVTDPLERVTGYVFDELNRLETITLADPDGSAGPLTSPLIGYVYDGLSRLKTLTEPAPLSNTAPTNHVPSTSLVIVDNGDSDYGTTGTWNAGGIPGSYQSDYDLNVSGTGADVATWTFTDLAPGVYEVSTTWVPHANRATDAPFTIYDDTAVVEGPIDIDQQTAAAADHVEGSVNFEIIAALVTITSDTLVVKVTDDADGYAVADAVRIEWVTPVIQAYDGTAPITVDLYDIFDDAEDPDSALRYTLVSNDVPDLFDSITFSADRPGLLTFDHAAGQTDTASIVVRATDTAGASVTATIVIDVDTATTGDFQLNETTSTRLDTSPTVAPTPDGGFFTAWNDYVTGDRQIRARHFNADGTADGASFLVTPAAADDYELGADVVATSDGNLVVAWKHKNATPDYDLRAQMYDAAGNQLWTEDYITLNSTTSGEQQGVALVRTEDGGFLAAWYGNGPGDSTGVFVRRFDAAGNPLSDELRMNSYTAGSQKIPDLVRKPGGGYMAFWYGAGPAGGSGDDIRMRQLDSEGSPIDLAGTDDVLINISTTNAQHRPTTAEGDFVVVWEGEPNAVGDADVFARLYSADGTPTSKEIIVSQTASVNEVDPSVTHTADGGFAVTWSEEVSGAYDIFMRRYDASGQPLAAATQVNSNTTGSDHESKINTLADGRVLVVWRARGFTGGDTYFAIAAELYPAEATPAPPSSDSLFVTAVDPPGSIIGAFNGITLTFSKPVVLSTLTDDGEADISLKNPSDTTITVTSVSQISPVQFRVNFDSQTAAGSYSLTLGTDISLAEQTSDDLDQDRDGTSDETEDKFYHSVYLAAASYTAAAVTSYEYDLSSRLTKVTDALGGETEYEYDAASNLTLVTDELDRQTAYEYDDVYRLTDIYLPNPLDGDPDGPHTVYAYDKASNLTLITDPLGNQTKYEYDARYRMTDLYLPNPTDGDPDGPHTVYTFDDANQLTLVTEPLDGTETAFNYDKLGRLNYVQGANPSTGVASSSQQTDYTYDDFGNLLTVSDPLGNVTAYAYDPLYNLSSVTLPDPDGTGGGNPLLSPITNFTYDRAGQMTSLSDPLSRLSSYEYDNLGRLTQLTLPTPNTSSEQIVDSDTTTGSGYIESNGSSWSDGTDVYSLNDDYRSHASGTGDNFARWTFTDLVPGQQYELYASWVAGSTHATDAEYTVAHGNESTTISVDQSANPIAEATPLTVNPMLFYNNSAFDDTGEGLTDSDAIAPDKYPLLPGQTAAMANISSYDEGINGLIIDFPNESTISAADFIFRTGDDQRPELWSTATAPTSVIIATGAGALGTDRVTIIWADDTIVDEWLQVTVLAAGTNLTSDEVFYFGNLVGEMVNSAGEVKVGLPDLTELLANWSTAADSVGIENVGDVDRDGDVDTDDSDLINSGHWGHTITLLSPPAEEAYQLLGTFTAAAKVMTVTLSDDADGVVIADAVKLIDATPTTSYEYDPASNLTSVTDARGFESRFGYDKLSRPTWTVNPMAGVMAYEFDAAHQQTAAIDQLGRVTTYDFDLLGRLTDVTLPDPDLGGTLASPVYQYQYDLASNLLTLIDPLDNETQYVYDKLYRLTDLYEADLTTQGNLGGPRTQYEYDDASRLTKLIDPLTRETDYVYDALHRTTSITAPDPLAFGGTGGPVTAFTYDNVGNVLTRTDPDPDGGGSQVSPVTSYAYDNLYRLETLTQPDPDGGGSETSPVTSYVYDAASQLTQITDPLNRDTTRDYDNLGRVVKVTDELSQESEYSFDAVGNLLFHTNDQGFSTLYDYDGLNRQTTSNDARDGLTQFAYDAASNLLSLTDPARNKTTWEYDQLDRTVRETNMLADARLFEYDSASNLTRRIDRRGWVRDFGYDNLYRTTSERWYNTVSDADTPTNDQNTMSFTFDIASQMLTADDDFSDQTYQYDKLGRVDDIVYANPNAPQVKLDHTYDLLSRRTDLDAHIHNGSTYDADFANSYAYDALSRMTQVIQQAQGGNSVADKRVDFAYNALGQFTDVDRHQNTAGTDLIVASDYTYDSLARLDLLTHKNDAGTPETLASYDWEFDSLNRIESFDSSYLWSGTTYNESVDYTYDANHQLIAADHTGTSDDESYVYDLNGNRQLATNTLGTNSEYETGDNNQLLSDGTYDYEYDEEGNRTKRTEISSGDYVVYTWDHRNRLVTVTEKDDTDATLKAVDQIYDTYNRWIGRKVDTTSPFDMADAAETHFIYDRNQIVLEFDDTQPGDLTHRYLWGPAIDQILSDEQYDPADPAHDDPATEEGEVLWPLTDHLNTVRDIAQHDATSGTALLVNHLEYNSFGLVTSETDTTVDLLFLYAARPFNESTGLQNNLNRWYDILVGAWISEDPIGFAGHDAKLDRYVHNSPTNHVDPSGLASPLMPDAEGNYGTGSTGTGGMFRYSELMPSYNGRLEGRAWVQRNPDGSISITGHLYVVEENGFRWLASMNLAEVAQYNYLHTKNEKYIRDTCLNYAAEVGLGGNVIHGYRQPREAVSRWGAFGQSTTIDGFGMQRTVPARPSRGQSRPLTQTKPSQVSTNRPSIGDRLRDLNRDQRGGISFRGNQRGSYWRSGRRVFPTSRTALVSDRVRGKGRGGVTKWKKPEDFDLSKVQREWVCGRANELVKEQGLSKKMAREIVEGQILQQNQSPSNSFLRGILDEVFGP